MVPGVIGQSAGRKSGSQERVGKEEGKEDWLMSPGKIGKEDRRTIKRMINSG